jgi:hypothetical protein
LGNFRASSLEIPVLRKPPVTKQIKSKGTVLIANWLPNTNWQAADQTNLIGTALKLKNAE